MKWKSNWTRFSSKFNSTFSADNKKVAKCKTENSCSNSLFSQVNLLVAKYFNNKTHYLIVFELLTKTISTKGYILHRNMKVNTCVGCGYLVYCTIPIHTQHYFLTLCTQKLIIYLFSASLHWIQCIITLDPFKNYYLTCTISSRHTEYSGARTTVDIL